MYFVLEINNIVELILYNPRKPEIIKQTDAQVRSQDGATWDWGSLRTPLSLSSLL